MLLLLIAIRSHLMLLMDAAIYSSLCVPELRHDRSWFCDKVLFQKYWLLAPYECYARQSAASNGSTACQELFTEKGGRR